MMELEVGDVYQVEDTEFGRAVLDIVATSDRLVTYDIEWLDDGERYYQWTTDRDVLSDWIADFIIVIEQ